MTIRGAPENAEFSNYSRALIADLPTYGYRRVHALLRRHAARSGRTAPNPKRVDRVMKVHGLLLQRHSSSREERRHEGRVAVDQRNTRWCSDALEIACDNGEKVRVAFALDCCDREAMGHVAITGGITAEDIRDLMVTTVEHRFGPVNRLAARSSSSCPAGSPHYNEVHPHKALGYRSPREYIIQARETLSGN